MILGVAHQYCRRRFVLTCKDFETPLGVVPTDRSYVDGLASLAGRDLFDDELSHRTEHSIEFQVVFLQYLLGGRRDFTIVPILVGSFHDLMERGIDPIADPDVQRFIEALRIVEAGHGKSVAYIGGIDLCHVGPEFGDPSPVDPLLQEQVRQFDGAMLDRAAAGDPEGWFRTAGRDRQSLAGLRPGGDVYVLARHRPGAGPAAQVRAGPGRSPDLLRELREHGVPRIRALARDASLRCPCPASQPPHTDEPAADPVRCRDRRDAGPEPAARPPCPAPADFRAEVLRYDAAAEIAAMGRPALPDDLPHPRPGPAAVPDPGDRLDLSRLCAVAQPAGGALPDDRLRLSRRRSRRRRPAVADRARPSGGRPVRADRPPERRAGLPGRALVRLDGRAQGLAPRAEAVPPRGGARGIRPPDVLGRRALGLAPGAAGPGHRRTAADAPHRSWPTTAGSSSPRSWTIAGTSTSSRTA